MRSFLPSKKNKNFLRILSADGALHFFSVKMRGVVPIFRLRRVTAAVCEKGVFFLVGASLWAEQTSAKDVTQKRGGGTHCRRVGWGPIVSPFLFRGKRRHG